MFILNNKDVILIKISSQLILFFKNQLKKYSKSNSNFVSNLINELGIDIKDPQKQDRLSDRALK